MNDLVDDVEDDVQMSYNFIDHHKPKKLTRRKSERQNIGSISHDHLGPSLSTLEVPSERHLERRMGVSFVNTQGLDTVTQTQDDLPGVETVASVTILASLPLSVDLDQAQC